MRRAGCLVLKPIQPSHELLIPIRKAGHAASGNSEWRNWHSAQMKSALRAIISGVNGDCARRSQNLVKLDINLVSPGTRPKLALTHARHCTPNASAFSCGRASGCKAQTLQPAPPPADSALPNHRRCNKYATEQCLCLRANMRCRWAADC